MPSNNIIQLRKGTATEWSNANPVLASGEPGFDITNGIFKIGDGSNTWTNLSSLNCKTTKGSFELVSSSGTFSVSGGYTVGALDVFLNGVKLASGDYTATDGTSFTLTDTAPSGSIVEYSAVSPGYIAPSISYATTQQSYDGVSTSVAMNPARSRDSNLGIIIFSPAGQSSAAANGGSANGAGIWSSLSSGATANGRAVQYLNNGGIGGSPFQNNVTYGRIDWTRRRFFEGRIYKRAGNSANHKCRILFGENFTVTVFDRFYGRGIGLDVRNNRYWILTHDGSTYTETDTGVDYVSNAEDVLVESDGNGTVTLFRNGTQIGSTNTGPKTAAVYACNFGWQVTNGGDASNNEWVFGPFRLSFK